MEPRTVFEFLREKLGEAVQGFEEAARPPFVVIAPGSALEAARLLRGEPALSFDSLMCLSGVDYKDRLAVAWHLYSMAHRHAVGVKIYLPREKPEVASVDSVWPAANFMEREAYDLLGIVFAGSRDLRRILLPEDWEGHPLRKDYKYPEFYHGIKV